MTEKNKAKFRRIRAAKIKKYAELIGGLSIPLAILLFVYLQSIEAITITGYSGDIVCAGTPENPCYAYLNFTANTDIYIYPAPNNTWLFSTDKKLKLLKMERKWGNGWREIKLNESCNGRWCGCYWCDRNHKAKYSYVFRKGRSYQIRFVGYKYNPYEDVKWSFGNEIDPIWKGIELKYKIEDINKNTKKVVLDLIKDFNLSELSALTGKPISYYFRLEKKNYFGDAEIKLKVDGIDWKKINPNNFILNKNHTIYEVFEGCKKFEKLPNGKWGCSVWTDVYILGQKLINLSWWNSSWQYRQAINISNTAGNLTNYQVKIELNSSNVGSNFNWSNNGSDIRFTNSTDDLLNFWIEYWNSSSQEAVLWVNVTYLENNTNTTIYMYYGNPSASSESNGSAVFEFFDDFIEGDTATTLQKIYSCENGAYGDNEDGKPAALGPNPIVAIYVPSQEKVYITYQGPGYDPYIFYYDVANDTISDTVKIGDNPTADSRYGDAHASPTLWLDSNGYIHVLYGGHGTAIKHSKSTNPYNISNWTLLSDFASEGTYPYVVANGSNVYVFYRHDNVRWYKKSTDGGNTFGSDIQWINTSGVYYKYIRNGDKVHFIMWYTGTGEEGKQLRYFYFDLNTETFHKVNGTQLSVPFAFTDADLAWTSPTPVAEAASIGADDAGNIYIIGYARQTHDTPATEHADIYAIKWNGSSWQSKDTGLDVEFATGWFYLAVNSSSEIDFYFVEMDSGGCGAFRKYTSSNGLDYTLAETIAEELTCRTIYTVCNENTEPIGGITFNDIITVNNVDKGDPHLGLYGEKFPAETTEEYPVKKDKWSGNIDSFTREQSLIKCSSSGKWIYTKTYQITDGIAAVSYTHLTLPTTERV